MSLRLRRSEKPLAGERLLPAPAGLLLRLAIADEIERLIAILDALDGDPDAEDDDDAEPSLGWTITMAFGADDDREIDVAVIAEERVQTAMEFEKPRVCFPYASQFEKLGSTGPENFAKCLKEVVPLA